MLQEIATRTPKAIIIKALYSKLLGFKRNDDEADIGVDIESEDLNQLLARYIYNFGQPPGLNRAEDFKLLRQEFSIALRHKEDQYELCLEVAKQSLEKGMPYVTFGVSPAARMLKDICKEVIVEVNRAKSLRFIPHPDNYRMYWAEYNIYHETSDLILKYFTRRHPMKILIIYSRREAFWTKKGEVYSKDINHFSLADIDEKYKEQHSVWQVAH